MIGRTVCSHVAHHATRTPDRVCLIERDRSISYGELDRLSNRLANALISRGIAPGAKIALLGDNSLDWIVVFIGIAKAGCVCVPLDTRLTPANIMSNYTDSTSELLIADSGLVDTLAINIPAEQKLSIGGTGDGTVEAFIGQSPDHAPGIEVRGEDDFVILYTGGTTGASKGVLLSHDNVFWNTLHEIIDMKFDDDDIAVIVTPLSHIAALGCWLLPHLYLGAASAVIRKYTPLNLARTISEVRATNGFMPPSMMRDLCAIAEAEDLDITCIRRWHVGGAPVSRSDRERMRASSPSATIFYHYGLSEGSGIVLVLKEKDYGRASDSLGKPYLHVEVKLLREDLTDASVGEVGEIVMRGPTVMRGYFNKPLETAAAFHDGWLRTGDMAEMDENGFFYYRDRLKDMIKTGGLNVYSQEVEATFLKHPAVREAAVFGMPSEKWGEEVTAVIVLRDGHNASKEEILGFARDYLPGYKIPKELRFVDYDSVPINPSGKIVKRELKNAFPRFA